MSEPQTGGRKHAGHDMNLSKTQSTPYDMPSNSFHTVPLTATNYLNILAQRDNFHSNHHNWDTNMVEFPGEGHGLLYSYLNSSESKASVISTLQ